MSYHWDEANLTVVMECRHVICFFNAIRGYRSVCLNRFHSVFNDIRETPMLVLSRKLGEKIVIGDNIVITVVKIDRNQIRIGIEAPHDVPVYREEIAPSRIEVKPALEEVTA